MDNDEFMTYSDEEELLEEHRRASVVEGTSADENSEEGVHDEKAVRDEKAVVEG